MIVELLTHKDRAHLGMTCQYNYGLVKRTTPIYCLQFNPIREKNPRRKTSKIFVFFTEQQPNCLMIQFIQTGKSVQITVVKDGNDEEEENKIIANSDAHDMASKCLEGWMTGTTIVTLDIRGEFTGRIPQNLKVTNFCFTEKSISLPDSEPTTSAIPMWLDRLEDGNMNLMLMGNQLNSLLSHKHFSNPMSACKLTAFDAITEEGITAIECKQIQLHNVKNEKVFNALLEKWSTGKFPASFEWLIIINLCEPFKTEELLLNHKVQSLDKTLFLEFDDSSSEISMDHFLVHGANKTFAVYSGKGSYARLLVINESVLEQIPALQKCLSEH